MRVKSIFFALLLGFSATCYAQKSFQLTKQQKKELKVLQKEGWKTLNPTSDLAEEYSKWHQVESEQRTDGNNRYLVEFSEVEDANLQTAERRAWGDACLAARRKGAIKVAGSIKTKESIDGKGEEHSEVAESQRSETNYSGSMNDIKKVFAIYKKTQKGYVVRIVAAKENK